MSNFIKDINKGIKIQKSHNKPATWEILREKKIAWRRCQIQFIGFTLKVFF